MNQEVEIMRPLKTDPIDDEAREVLCLMAKYADANVGISWDSIDVWADWVRDLREAKNEAEAQEIDDKSWRA